MEATRYKVFAHSAKLTNLITVAKFPGSVLYQLSLVLVASYPQDRIPMRTSFPMLERVFLKILIAQ